MWRLIALLAFAPAGCAHTQTSWRRVDGSPVVADQLQVDETVCRGEAEKANMTMG